ncbi:hypothetical protein [Nonomuraea sp. NPDC049784]|uniref:hypothetical protein n=1 Tax=Nonomuraea sp. NPDC049784 TaxID=3154361 RepID=UPI0033CC1B07
MPGGSPPSVDVPHRHRALMGALVREAAFGFGIPAAAAAVFVSLLDWYEDHVLDGLWKQITLAVPPDSAPEILDQVAVCVRGRADRSTETGEHLAASDAVRLAVVGFTRRTHQLSDPGYDYRSGIEAARAAVAARAPRLSGEELRGALDYAEARAHRSSADGRPLPSEQTTPWQQLAEQLIGNDHLGARPPIVRAMPLRPVRFGDIEQILNHLKAGGDYADDARYAEQAHDVHNACSWYAASSALAEHGRFLLYRTGPNYYNRPWTVADPGSGLNLAEGRTFWQVKQAEAYAEALKQAAPDIAWGHPDLAARWPAVRTVIRDINLADHAYQQHLALERELDRQEDERRRYQARDRQIGNLMAQAKNAARRGELAQALAAAEQAERLDAEWPDRADPNVWRRFRVNLEHEARGHLTT